MKRSIASLGLVAILATSLAGAAAAQSEDGGPSDGSVITLLVSFDTPVLAGYTATVSGVDGAVSTVEDDSTLRIDLPADAGPFTEVGVSLAADGSASAARVSANDASFDELVAALQSVDVSPADRWAREIMEYRPYDPGDPTLAQLQDQLAKYNPSAETLAGILSVLEP